MSARVKIRLHVDDPLVAGCERVASPPQAHYLRRVMRLGDGDQVALFNGRDGEWQARIATEGRGGCRLLVETCIRPQVFETDATLAFAPVKRLRLDYLVQKACELGAVRLIPVLTRHTGPTRVNVERLRANAIEAAEQCGRLSLPEVVAPVRFDAFLAGCERLFWADEQGGVNACDTFDEAGPGPATLLIGPEGGFAEDERAALTAHDGALAISLGPRILRADTAAVSLLTLWQAAVGDWRNDCARQSTNLPL